MSAARNLAGLGNQNTFAVESVANEVGIASTAPSSTLDVRGEVRVGTTIQAGVAGVLTATSFSGSGANLTGIAVTQYIDADSLTVSGISTIVRLAVTNEVATGIITALGLSGNLTGAAATLTGALSGNTGTFSGAVNVDATTDSTSTSTGALIVDGGLGVAKNVYIGAGLSVAGTLTYEDVTSVDSVGLITAKSGVNVSGGQVTIGTGITMGIAGVATFSGTGDVHLHDNVRLNVGDASDLSIYHNGSHSYIEDSGTGRLIAKTSYFEVDNAAGNEAIIEGIEDGAVKLYYNGSQKFESTNDGVVITGITTSDGLYMGDDERIRLGDSQDLQIYHHSSHDSYVSNGTGFLALRSTEDVRLTSDSNELMVKGIVDGAVEVYYNNSKKFETTNDGTVTTGIATATDFFVNTAATKGLKNTDTGQRLIHQASNETRIYHASNAQVKLTFRGTGDTYRGAVNADANGMALLTGAASEEYGILCVADGATNLYYDASKKFETTNDGVNITGIMTASSGANLDGILSEKFNTTAGKLSDNTNIDLEDGMVHYFTTTESTTCVPNIRYNSSKSLNNMMSIGDVISVTVITTAAAAGYSVNWTIDGSAVTEEWIGGSAPSAGGSNGYDITSLTILKTADATWKVFVNVSNAT